MKKILGSLVVTGLLATNVFAAVHYDFSIRAGAKNVNMDGGSSTTLTDVQFTMDLQNDKFPNLYMGIGAGYEVGSVDGATLDSGNFQYNFGWRFNKIIPYATVGFTSENDLYANGTLFYGAGLKYNITNSFGVDLEYTSATSGSGDATEPDSSNISAFIRYKFYTK